MLDFVDINKDNIHNYCRFSSRFKGDIEHFRHSLYPRQSDFFVPLIENNQLAWSYLFHDGRIIGAIWLEKDHATLCNATLGVFITEKERRNLGIGTEAVNKYIEQNKEKMNICNVTIAVNKDNIRAINCFKKCNFDIEKEFEADGIKKFMMINKLK